MILLALADIHSKTSSLKSISGDLATADAVLLAGDITHFGDAAELSAVLDEVKKSGRPVFAVAGNCDRPEAAATLAESECGIEGRAVSVGGVAIAGIGGSLPCPGTTPNEFSEADFGRLLSQGPFASLSSGSFIFVSHEPPLNTAVDKAWIMRHVGSREIRRFVETKKPLLCVTGHIHESRGVDTIGETRIVNPGAFKSGNYAVIEIENMKVKDISLKKV
ncbi:MAG TPA: metallophosphoesterase family protein [Chitinivibrionales bacterium]|nr:metallophosphoesterase family protein [Chitinivibrionales bacterium]